MIPFASFRATVSAPVFLRHGQLALPTIHKCCTLKPITVPVRYAASIPRADHLRNANIPYETVYLVTDGRLGPPTPLSHLLASIDPQEVFIELVNEKPQPIVKIISKRDRYVKQKEWRKKQREVALSNMRKEIQLTWGIEPGDLEHKLDKARRDIEKGIRVELVFAPKANQRPPSPAAMQNRLNETTQKISEFAMEWSPRRVERGVVILYLKKLHTSSKPS